MWGGGTIDWYLGYLTGKNSMHTVFLVGGLCLIQASIYHPSQWLIEVKSPSLQSWLFSEPKQRPRIHSDANQPPPLARCLLRAIGFGLLQNIPRGKFKIERLLSKFACRLHWGGKRKCANIGTMSVAIMRRDLTGWEMISLLRQLNPPPSLCPVPARGREARKCNPSITSRPIWVNVWGSTGA